MDNLEKNIYSLSIRVSDDPATESLYSKTNCKYIFLDCGKDAVLLFVDKLGEVYITPYISSTLKKLEQLGYQNMEHSAQFIANTKLIECLANNYVTSFAWRQLKDSLLKKIARDRFSKKGISDLPDFVKGLSIKVPKDVTCTRHYGEHTSTRSLSFTMRESLFHELLGTMHILNFDDMVMYVDQNGDSYLIHAIFSETIKEAGYDVLNISSDYSLDADSIVINFQDETSEFYSQYKAHLELVGMLKDRMITPSFIIDMGESLYKEKFPESSKSNSEIGIKKQ